MGELLPAPTFGHAAEAFVVAHAVPAAWSSGTAVKYRQTLAALELRLGKSPRRCVRPAHQLQMNRLVVGGWQGAAVA